MPTEPSCNEILDFALKLSSQVREIILPLWKNVVIEYKRDGTEVTEADRSAEQFLRRRIGERYPDHAILGEEFGGAEARNAEHLWVIDPIDGTASFSLGLPVFGTLIGYLVRGEPCVGVIAAHALGETFYAATGQGCWCQRDSGGPQQIRASTVQDPADAVIAATAFDDTDLDPRAHNPSMHLSRLYRGAKRFRWSGDCVNYALVCQGRLDVAIDTRVHPWDVAALVPCVREAGGILTPPDGSDDVVWGSQLIASANAGLHARVLAAIQPA